MSSAALWGVLGTALGATLRFELSRWIVDRFGDAFPWATLAVNTTGCLAAGVLLALQPQVPSAAWWFLGPGLLGGFTTVSTFALETVLLARRGRARAGGLYALATVSVCVGSVALGAGLARILLP